MSDPGGFDTTPSAQQPPAVLPAVPPAGWRRKWLRRAVGAAVAALAFAGTWVGLNASALRAKYAAGQLASAATDAERARLADELLGYGEPGVRLLAAGLCGGAEPVRAAAGAAFDRHLAALPEGDPRAVTISALILEAAPAAPPEGKCAVLGLVRTILSRTGSAHTPRCRALVAEGLLAAEPDTRLAAVRLAIHPDLRFRDELKPLLAAAEPEVRRAALFVAATVPGDPLLTEDELFRLLHDADAGVRKVCRSALTDRNRSEAEIALAWRLTHPDPTERLKLLLDLRYDDDVADPEPWLERLSRDPEPAVRAGAARVAVESAAVHKFPPPRWVADVADGDPHPTVRFVATYYRTRPVGEPVRPAGGQ
jgi:hypothetical protein